ncbi:hypothetical protein [Alkalihalobacillus deserti]|uniref:hypothetical protein n=1 Tax=Alkalihalobacillus deserti TaxID=2879466 RepID=UPI001D14A60A|nr:hypothetical protein [Alkalihalobacillus deserti]
MSQRNEDIEIERKEKKSDPSKVAATFIKYAAYVIILVIILWFLVQYILPKF